MRMIHILALAVAGAAALAIVNAGTSGARDGGSTRTVDAPRMAADGDEAEDLPPGHPPIQENGASPSPMDMDDDPELPPGHPPIGANGAAPTAAPAAAGVEGEVKEVLQVDKYTYLRLDRAGDVVWAAVPRQDVPVGRRVRVTDATPMDDFSSPSLGRTFERVWFGVLDERGGSAVASSHGDVSSAAGAPPKPHSIDRARGEGAKTVAEIVAQSAKLAGTTVRVRAKVTKRTEGVLGKTWLHVSDGGERDLVVTTTARAELGAVVLLEGRVATDRDLGSGYRYAVLLEDARVLETPP